MQEFNSKIKVTTFSSKGRASRVMGLKTKKIHHFHSDNQYRAFLLFEWNDFVVDIRENVQLLDLMEAIDNKEDLRLDKFTDKETGKQYDFFTNFILTIKTNSGQKLVARTIKNTSELNRKITIERLEIERRYFEAKSVEWKIITDKQINKQLCKNIEWVRETLLGDDIGIDKDKYAKGLYSFLLSSKEIILNKVLKEYEIRESLEKGTGLYLFRYLIAKKDIEIDMYKKVDISLKVDELIQKFNI